MTGQPSGPADARLEVIRRRRRRGERKCEANTPCPPDNPVSKGDTFRFGVSVGPDAGNKAKGTLAFVRSPNGTLKGSFTPIGGTAVNILGQTSGLSVSIVLPNLSKTLVFGSGQFSEPLSAGHCGIRAGGTLTGPAEGDLGDWIGTALPQHTGKGFDDQYSGGDCSSAQRRPAPAPASRTSPSPNRGPWGDRAALRRPFAGVRRPRIASRPLTARSNGHLRDAGLQWPPTDVCSARLCACCE